MPPVLPSVAHGTLFDCRLEEMNERRQAMVGKLKGVEKELSGLEGKKVEAEAYISKQAERLRCSILGNSINKHRDEVRCSGSHGKATARHRAECCSSGLQSLCCGGLSWLHTRCVL
jgi:hypothetical protein